MDFFHLQNVRYVRVLRTRDRILRSKRLFIHSLLGLSVRALTPDLPRNPLVKMLAGRD